MCCDNLQGHVHTWRVYRRRVHGDFAVIRETCQCGYRRASVKHKSKQLHVLVFRNECQRCGSHYCDIRMDDSILCNKCWQKVLKENK